MARKKRPPAGLDVAALAGRLKIAADPTRLTVLLALAGRDHDGGELCDLSGQNPPAASYHLQLLSAAGLVWSRRSGGHTYFTLTDAGRAAVEAARGVAGGLG